MLELGRREVVTSQRSPSCCHMNSAGRNMFYSKSHLILSLKLNLWTNTHIIFLYFYWSIVCYLVCVLLMDYLNCISCSSSVLVSDFLPCTSEVAISFLWSSVKLYTIRGENPPSSIFSILSKYFMLNVEFYWLIPSCTYVYNVACQNTLFQSEICCSSFLRWTKVIPRPYMVTKKTIQNTSLNN